MVKEIIKRCNCGGRTNLFHPLIMHLLVFVRRRLGGGGGGGRRWKWFDGGVRNCLENEENTAGLWW